MAMGMCHFPTREIGSCPLDEEPNSWLGARRRWLEQTQDVESEECDECGFDGEAWSPSDAVGAIGGLPAQWRQAVDGLTEDDVLRRPTDQIWSIAEYADHVREVLFGMRLLLETALTAPGTDLGASPASRFDEKPRRIEVTTALDGIENEADGLRGRLAGLSAREWEMNVKFDGRVVDAQWIVRHAVHDATHHLDDVSRLRTSLTTR
jgi:DinB superfamily